MFWGDAELGTIEGANLDGTGRSVILTETNVRYFAFVLHDRSIYFTDWHSAYGYFLFFCGDEMSYYYY